jgi:hypothetical protein
MQQRKWMLCGLRAIVLVVCLSLLIACFRGQRATKDRLLAAESLIAYLLNSPEVASTRGFYGGTTNGEITLLTPRNWPRGELKALKGLQVHSDINDLRESMLGISIGRFELGPVKNSGWDFVDDTPISVVIFNAGKRSGVIGRCYISLQAHKSDTGWEVDMLQMLDP